MTTHSARVGSVQNDSDGLVTYEGMAHMAMDRPERCGTGTVPCFHFEPGRDETIGQCGKYKLMRGPGKTPKRFVASAHACKYYEPARVPTP
jgi:hypothetical protein